MHNEVPLSFEDRGTDRRKESNGNVLSKTFQMIYDIPINAENCWRRRRQYTSPVTLEVGINTYLLPNGTQLI